MDPLIPIGVFGGYLTLRYVQMSRALAALPTDSEQVQEIEDLKAQVIQERQTATTRVKRQKARTFKAYQKLNALKQRLANHEDQKVRGCVRKEYFDTKQRAKTYIKAQHLLDTHVYSCPHCPGYHLTTKSQEKYND